jgi:hypothetical protein
VVASARGMVASEAAIKPAHKATLIILISDLPRTVRRGAGE